jgi:hypothetical protein
MLETLFLLATLVAVPALLAYAAVRWGVDSREYSTDARRPQQGLSVI